VNLFNPQGRKVRERKRQLAFSGLFATNARALAAPQLPGRSRRLEGATMIQRVSGVLAAAVLTAAFAAPASAGTRPASANAGPIVVAQASEAPARRSRKRTETRSKREPTASQMAARERQQKCAAEWKSAKADGRVAGGTKWPKFWSQCNARLKGNSA
jgi:hypothetical protein